MRWPLTYRWYAGYTHNEQGIPALPWLDEHVGLGKVLHEAVLVTDSNEASLELERCQSSAGLQVKMKTLVTLVCMLWPTRNEKEGENWVSKLCLEHSGVTKSSDVSNYSCTSIIKLTCDGPQSS